MGEGFERVGGSVHFSDDLLSVAVAHALKVEFFSCTYLRCLVRRSGMPVAD